MKLHKSQQGFTLVEVIIAAGIGMGVVWSIFLWMTRTSKEQVKTEKRSDLVYIQEDIRKKLGSFVAWEKYKDHHYPNSENEVNFNYWNEEEKKLLPLTVMGQVFRGTDPGALDCINPKGSCRLAFYRYNGVLLPPDQVNPNLGNIFKVVLEVESDKEDISPISMPKLKVTLTDLHRDRAVRLNPKVFYIDSAKQPIDYDPISNARCFRDFMLDFPDKAEMAQVLCDRSFNLAPVECFKKMKKLSPEMEDLLALVVCNKAQNHFPYVCYQEMIQKFATSPTMVAQLCSGAVSRLPAQCFLKIWSSLEKKVANEVEKSEVLGQMAENCSKAQNLDPADCFLSLTENDLSRRKYAVKLCPHHRQFR